MKTIILSVLLLGISSSTFAQAPTPVPQCIGTMNQMYTTSMSNDAFSACMFSKQNADMQIMMACGSYSKILMSYVSYQYTYGNPGAVWCSTTMNYQCLVDCPSK